MRKASRYRWLSPKCRVATGVRGVKPSKHVRFRHSLDSMAVQACRQSPTINERRCRFYRHDLLVPAVPAHVAGSLPLASRNIGVLNRANVSDKGRFKVSTHKLHCTIFGYSIGRRGDSAAIKRRLCQTKLRSLPFADRFKNRLSDESVPLLRPSRAQKLLWIAHFVLIRNFRT